MIQDKDLISEYANILRDYLQERNEANLNRLAEFVRKLVGRGITPEAILAVHFELVRDMMKGLSAFERSRLMGPFFQCLSEILTEYRLAVTERLKSKKLESDRIRKYIYLLEKGDGKLDPHREKGQEPASKTEHQGKALLSGRPSRATFLG